MATAAASKAAARRAPSRASRPRGGAASGGVEPRRRANIPTPPGGYLIPLAVGRTAGVVRQLPDSGAIVRLTRSRAWIAVLGLLLIGIVAVNVFTLSLTATAGRIDTQIRTLEQENSILRAREARLLTNERVQSAASIIGLATPSPMDVNYREAGPEAVEAAAARLSASG